MKKIALILLVSNLAFCRSPLVQLLPPRAFASRPAVIQERKEEKRSAPISLALELGALGRQESTRNDVLGMQVLLGGRISAKLPMLFQSFYLKPSIGYFRKSEVVAQTSVTQNVFEGGLGLHFLLANTESVGWSLGVSNRFDLASSTLSVLDSSASSGSTWRYRVGPAMGLSFGLTETLRWVTDVELSFDVSQGGRQYGGLTTGISFSLE